MTDSLDSSETRFGFVTVIGEPNAGKSTLINALVGDKISIVSPKVQTTRTRTLGILCHDNTQISFIDTPGIFEPSKKNKMERAIVASAYEGITEGDCILLLVDASKKKQSYLKSIIQKFNTEDKPKRSILVLNKIDKVEKEDLLALASGLNELYPFEATFMVSALKNKGLDDLLSFLSKSMPLGLWHYPEDQMTDMPLRLLAAEITREKLFHLLQQELPYHLTVETTGWENFNDDSIKIDQTIFVTRESHKKIILGKGGSFIKKIGSQARHELIDILETTIHLKLFVKVRPQWMDDDERYKMWGLDSKA